MQVEERDVHRAHRHQYSSIVDLGLHEGIVETCVKASYHYIRQSTVAQRRTADETVLSTTNAGNIQLATNIARSLSRPVHLFSRVPTEELHSD